MCIDLRVQDARFHFSEAAFANAGALGAPTNDDLLTAFMPGCDDAGGGGSSGSAGLFGSAGIFAGLSSLGAPSTGGSSQRAGTLPLRPSPLSKCSSGGSGDNAPGSNGGSGSGCASRPPPQRQPPSNSVSSTLPISALMFPAGSMHSDSSMPLGPMLRAPPVQQAAAQQEQTSQRRPGDAPAGPLLTVQQAQQDMQRFLNAEPAQQVGRGTGTGAGASNNAAAAAPRQQKPQSAFTGYSQPAPKPQGSGQLQPPARLTAQPSMQSAGTTQQGPWAMAPQQQWASAQWGAGPQQALAMRQQQAIGAAFGQQGVMPQQAPGQQPQGPAPSGAPFGVAPPQQAAAGQQTSGQPQPQSTQQQQQQPPTAAPGQPALPPGLSQQQQMAMLQWQQMQLQQMQAAFAMQQQALASGQQLPFAGAPGMGPFGNPYMAQFPMSGGMWPPQLSGAQLMMMQQQAQQASMQQQAMQQAQAAQQQAQAQQQQAPPQQQCTSQPLSQGHPPQQQQQQPQQTACCGPAAVQALLQPGLASAHSSGTQAALQQQQSQQQQQQAAAASHPQRAPSSCLTNGAAPMSGVVQGAQRTVSNATNLTLSDAGVAHIKWEYGGSSAAPQGDFVSRPLPYAPRSMSDAVQGIGLFSTRISPCKQAMAGCTLQQQHLVYVWKHPLRLPCQCRPRLGSGQRGALEWRRRRSARAGQRRDAVGVGRQRAAGRAAGPRLRPARRSAHAVALPSR